MSECGCLLAVRIKGSIGASLEEKATLAMLNLKRANHATIVKKTPSYEGMLKKVSSYLTWGEPSLKLVEKLFSEKGEMYGNKKIDDENAKLVGFNSLRDLAMAVWRGDITMSRLKSKGMRPYFRLHPPKKGFKGSIKRPFGSKGEFGYRGSKIDELVERMI